METLLPSYRFAFIGSIFIGFLVKSRKIIIFNSFDSLFLRSARQEREFFDTNIAANISRIDFFSTAVRSINILWMEHAFRNSRLQFLQIPSG